MILNYDKVRFHANHISRDVFEDNVPHVHDLINADIYLIAAYIHALIGTLSMKEYDVRQFLTEQGFGNTVIVSLLINANLLGTSERPLWSRDEDGILHPE